MVDELERVFAAYGPLDRQQFLDSLEELDFQDPNWLYMEVPDDPDPWQGDVIPEIEIHFTTEDGLAGRYVGEAMVLSHGCDVVPDQDPTAVLAPVWEIPAFLDRQEDLDKQQRESKRANLIRNRTPNLFYLPGPTEDAPERVVNFALSGSVSTIRIVSAYEEADPEDILRLSDNGWYLLTGKLAHHFVRKEDSNDFPRD